MNKDQFEIQMLLLAKISTQLSAIFENNRGRNRTESDKRVIETIQAQKIIDEKVKEYMEDQNRYVAMEKGE